MKNQNKLIICSILTIFLFSAVSAETPQRPHNIYGTLTEKDTGEKLSGYNIQILDESGTVLKSTETDSNGFYDLYISNPGSGDFLTVRSSEDRSSSVMFSSGKVSEVNLKYDIPDGTEENKDSDKESKNNQDEKNYQDQVSNNYSVPSKDTQPDIREVEAETKNRSANVKIHNLTKNQKIKVILDKDQSQGGKPSSVESVGISSSEDIGDISLKITDIGPNKPNEIGKKAAEMVYSYQEISIGGVEDKSIQMANITFKVRKAFLEERERSPEDVVMKRFNKGRWNSLDTKISGELEEAYKFKAESKGSPYYAIALEDQQNQDNQSNNTTREAQKGHEASKNFPLLPLMVASMFAILVGIVYIWRRI